MFKKKEKELEPYKETMCDIVLRKKILVHGIWDYKNNNDVLKTKKTLQEKGFRFIRTETTNNLYGHWEEDVWEKEIGTQLY